jgi:hypothetical protein
MKNTIHNFDTKMKYQKYSHYLLPIAINPLNYGKLIEQFGDKYIIQLNTSNILVIKVLNNENFIRFFRKGNLMIEFTDKKISDISFTRTISDQRFTFEKNNLISTEILSVLGDNIKIFSATQDTDSIKLNPLKNPIQYFYKTNLFKKYQIELFILMEAVLILLVILFCVFTEDSESLQMGSVSIKSTALFSTQNIIRLRKRKSIHNWNAMEFNLGNVLFTIDLFKTKFKLFWDRVEPEFTIDNHMFILFKVKYQGSDFATIGNLQRINQNDKDWYINWIINNMILKSEYYNETAIESFIFSYGFKNEKISTKEIIKTNLNIQNYKNNKLVISYNPLDFGKLISEIRIENYTQFILQNIGNILVKINQFEKYNEVSLISGGNTILNFKDEWISENKFVRILDNKKFYFENNLETLFTKEIKGKFISKLSGTKNLKNEFITLDIETFIKDSILTPYCVCIYDGKTKSSFYLSDYTNVRELIITALKSIMIRKYNGYNVYMHNMAKFDIIFLLKYLIELGTVQPRIHNGRIINIDLKFGKSNKYQLQFRDSYLLLLSSLDKLCKSFTVVNTKIVFPIFFVKEDNLNYIGKVPKIKYFKNISEKDYASYKSNFNNNWNLKNEAVKYCNLDCISLHQVMTKFTGMIFELFEKNVHHYPTLPSLAFAIFRSKFMIEENIPQLSGKIANDIRSGYTGGSCDVFIPETKPGIKIKCYDVNSLYPSVMKDCLLPVGLPTFFNGDIRAIDINAFGFFYCKIIAPDNIKHPIIQTHVKTNGIRTVSPIGTWEDIIFSEEMDNAKNFGYQFEILWGYTFKKEYIFKNYVDYLYNFRLNYPKSDPMNFIAKILLNSLYGRFGMDDNFMNIDIIHKDFYSDFENIFLDNIIETQDLGDYILVQYKIINELENNNEIHNTSIGIAAAITAYSRIHMTQFKNNLDINLYYTDTDSIYTDSDIDKSFLSETVLGKLKLENTS